MANHDEVADRFAQALKARQDANRAKAHERYEAAERAVAPTQARVDGIKDGLDSLGDRGYRIHSRSTDAGDGADLALDIVMTRDGKSHTIGVKVASNAGARQKIYLDGLPQEAAKALGERTGVHASGSMAVDLNCSEDVADAIEAAAVEYFGEG